MDSIPGILEAKIAELEKKNKALLELIRKCLLVMQHAMYYVPEARRDNIEAAIKASAETLEQGRTAPK